MKPTFHTKYRPLTARPFLRGASYSEYAPCNLLAPYIACFWESSGAHLPVKQDVLVIPDTCADIIIEIDHTRQTVKSLLCGLADIPVTVKQKSEDITSFAVRFYFWAVHLFFDVDMRELYNQTFDFELVAPAGSLELEKLLYMSGTRERIVWMENLLLKRLRDKMPESCQNPDLCNAIAGILDSSGDISIKELCGYACVSQRQMERLFVQQIGFSIKRMANLVRYQNVWRDIATNEQFDVRDAVVRYGFTDQSHLLREFKRYHGVTPVQARQIALRHR